MTYRPRHALLVGTSRYQYEELPDLPSCAVDVSALAEVLRDREIGAYTDVRIVLDQSAAQIGNEIGQFLDSVGPDGLALVYFTGHGLRASRTTGEFFFAATDTDPKRPESSGVRASFVNELLEVCRATQKVAILDCCLSGGFVHGFRVREELPGEGQPVAKGVNGAASSGVFVLSSSGPTELSFSGVQGPDGQRPSRFTEVIVDALWTGLGGTAQRGGQVSVTQLQEHVQTQMQRLQPPQTPLYCAFAVDGRMTIAEAPRGPRPSDRPTSVEPVEPIARPTALPGTPDWRRLLAYFQDHVLAESSERRLLDARDGGGAFVCLTGEERLISGALDDGEMPVPSYLEGWLAGRDPNAELWTGYPAVVLNESAGAGGQRFAPLFVRRVEVTDRQRLRPFGPVLPNAELARELLDAETADQLIDSYEPAWLAGEHGRLGLEARAILATDFGMPCVEELEPERLSSRLDLNSPGQGARNAAVLFTAVDNDKFTKGLREDLAVITGKAAQIDGTALGLLARPRSEWPRPEVPEPRMVTPHSANDTQRTVLRLAMTQPLTVATGPPGTGKSQLVTNVIATAIANGQKVLLASNNHAAVNEVCAKFAEFAPGGLVRTRDKDRPDIEKEALESLCTLAAPPQGSVDTARAKLHQATETMAELDRELAEGAWAEVALARTATELLERASQLRVDLASLRQRIEPDPGRWVRRARRAADASWFAAWRRRRLMRQAGVDERQADENGCQALLVVAEALHEQAGARAVAMAQRPDREAAIAVDAAALGVQLTSTELVRAQVRASAHSGRGAIDELLRMMVRRKPDWPLVRKVLDRVPAWAVTTLSVRRFPPDPQLFDLVVIDEASQCSLSNALPLLFRARRALIIGDPMQLSAITKVDAVEAARIRRRHRLSASWLEERGLLATNSAYDAAARAYGDPVLLDEHFRCHPDIADAASRLFYGGRWTVLTDIRGRPSVEGPAVRGSDVCGEARRGSGRKSWTNAVEAERVVDEVSKLLDALPPEASIGVVTPFTAQAKLIAARVEQRCGPLEENRFLSATVHTFQGGQRDVMLLSLTARGEHASGAMNWMNKQYELWNVAITRARSNLFVVGDLELWRSRSEVVRVLLDGASESASAGGWANQLYGALLRQTGLDVRLGVSRRGHRVDAMVPMEGAEVAVVVDDGAASDLALEAHRRRILRRCALLGDDVGPAVRVPTWKLIEGADLDLGR
ncbi:caspase, EACC1-associated type [Pseudonocardia spinosispora]|uniref:caspase, EACC1-associated type n=1 Tax=Pseudonocardia spinosispora TaxID=103441 RepID=UPI0004050B9F|nr:AAA domain-containing protein [Pseudonocardia spinosispora]